MLCGLIHWLPHGVDILIRNELQEVMHVTVVTQAGADTTTINTSVYSESENIDEKVIN